MLITVHHRPQPSSTVHHHVVIVKYYYVIAIDVILYIVTNAACHQRNKRAYMDRLYYQIQHATPINKQLTITIILSVMH